MLRRLEQRDHVTHCSYLPAASVRQLITPTASFVLDSNRNVAMLTVDTVSLFPAMAEMAS